jgi:hypothetical protein
MDFRQFLEHNPFKIYSPAFTGNTVGTHNDGNRDGSMGAFLPTTGTGSENLGPYGGLPGTDIQIPNVTTDSTVQSIEGDKPRPGKKCKDPIWITMMDGTRFAVSWDSFKRNYAGLEEGDKLRIVFERNPGDSSPEGSRIIKVSRI